MLEQVETHTAAIVKPLLTKYGLTPKSAEQLAAEGKRDADKAPPRWDDLIAHMAKTFPDYMPSFERLEAMAPPEDRAILKRMTAHEVAAIAFLTKEIAGDAGATLPLIAFLCDADEAA